MTTKAYVQVQIGINIEIPGKLTRNQVEDIIASIEAPYLELKEGKIVYSTIEGVPEVVTIMYENE